MHRTLLATVALLLVSCTSVEWAEPTPELPTSWRHCQLFVSDAAYVLASSEDAAAEAHALAAEAQQVIAAEFGRDPGRGLILALSFDDPLPIEDPKQYSEALHDWHTRVTGADGPPMDLRSRMRMGPDSEPIEVDPALPLHLVGAPIPADQTRLDLPPALVEAAAFVAVLPTPSCLEDAADAMVDIACEAKGISSAALWTMSLVVGHPATMLRDKFLERTKVTLYEAWLPVFEPTPERAFAVLQRGGLIDPDAVYSPPPPPPERGKHWYELMTREMRFPKTAPRFAVDTRPAGDLMHLLPQAGWNGFVDTGPRPDNRISNALHDANKQYLHLPMASAVPSRADAERLGQFYAELAAERHRPSVFVYGDHEFGAALVASHAFWVLGRSRDEALEIAKHYGAGDLLPALPELWEQKR